MRFSRTFPDGIASESHHPQQAFPPENGTLRIAATTFEWPDIPLVDADGAASAAAARRGVLKKVLSNNPGRFRVCDLSCTVWTFVDQKDPMSGIGTTGITSHRMEMAEVGCESAVRFVTRL